MESPSPWPSYLGLSRAEIVERRDGMLAELSSCQACPRRCRADRRQRSPSCGIGRQTRVSAAFPHHGEEDCLRGSGGSGTIFFSGCNLSCVFCQNADTSDRRAGREVGAGGIARLMLALQQQGCHNINLVTPEHVVPQILEALPFAIDGGLELPIVYNSSGYDSEHSLAMLNGIVDIYMPDFKVWTEESAHRYLGARDYPDVARRALAAMHAQVGPLFIETSGVARRGLLVRHLVLPGLLRETREILRFLAGLSPDTYVNLMDQYRPQHRAREHAEIDRLPTQAELREAREAFFASGLRRLDGYTQLWSP